MKCNKNQLLKNVLITLFSIICLIILILDIFISINLCISNNISLDYTLMVSGMNVVGAWTIFLIIIEALVWYYLVRLLKKISFVKLLYNLKRKSGV